MYYSITFTNTSGVKKNTWADWRLIPSSPPVISPPEVYTNYVDIPGRPEGPIDLSEALTGGPSYKNSSGSWEFIMDDEGYTRPEFYLMLKKFLHGQRMKIELEEDPYHYYMGRTTISALRTGRSNSVITITYEISPVRYKTDGTKDGF